MPEDTGFASDTPNVTAPDGIAIHFFATPAAALVGVAEGRIPPGRYGIHRHLSLEQYTYVLDGRLTAITGSERAPEGQATELGPGALLLTAAGESLQFVNEGSGTVRVLFICAPPYPPDDADTVTLDRHSPPSRVEREAMVMRLERVRAGLNASIDARLVALRADG